MAILNYHLKHPLHGLSMLTCSIYGNEQPTTPEISLFGYGSIPINTIFRGMNIHLPAILMWTTGVQGFDTLPFDDPFLFGWFWGPYEMWHLNHPFLCGRPGPREVSQAGPSGHVPSPKMAYRSREVQFLPCMSRIGNWWNSSTRPFRVVFRVLMSFVEFEACPVAQWPFSYAPSHHDLRSFWNKPSPRASVTMLEEFLKCQTLRNVAARFNITIYIISG